MLQRLRNIINNNRLYAWMLIAMILVQAYVVSIRQDSAPTAPDFKQELEKNSQLIKKVLLENQRLALTLGYMFLFMFCIFLLGLVLLSNFIYAKIKGIEPIPKTLGGEALTCTWKDAVKITIIALFINHIYYILRTPGIDRRQAMVLDTLVMDILVFLFILYFVIVKYKQKITVLGISLKNILENIGIALFGYIALLPVLAVIFFCVLIIARAFNYTPPAEPIYELVFKEQRPILLALISVMVALLGPAIEEVFFRGFLYSALKNSLTAKKAMVISAFIFSLLHTNVLGFVPILTLGIFLAYLREKTGSLIPSIAVHIMHNTALAGLMFLTRKILTLA